MKHLKAYENNIEDDDISKFKRFIVVNYDNATKFKYAIYEIIDTNIDKEQLTITRLYTYNNDSKRFKHHTQSPYVTSFRMLKFNKIVLTSNSMKECRDYIIVAEDINKFNL